MAEETPIVQKVVETKETTAASTETAAAAVISPSPAPVADDAIRREMGREVLASEFLITVIILVALFRYGANLPKEVSASVFTLIGSILGFKARDTGTVIGYLFGSSSGSTAKSALLEKGK